MFIMRLMRIGIDGIPLAAAKTGVGHYTFELARHLASGSQSHEFELVSPFPFTESVLDEQSQLPPNLKLVQARTSPLRKHWWTIGLPLYARQASFDLFHGTNYNVPLWNRCPTVMRSEEHTSELQSQSNLVCRLLLEKKKKNNKQYTHNKKNATTRSTEIIQRLSS